MNKAVELFIQDEHQVGHYQAQILRQSSSEQWSVTIPPLHLVVTNYRLIIWPQTRKPYPPASIPAAFIKEVYLMEINRRQALHICLKTGHRLHMVIGTGACTEVLGQIRRMGKLPTGWGRLFTVRLARQDVSRLIEFVEKI